MPPNPLLLDLVEFLEDKKIIEGDGVDAFRDFTPDKPDSIVVLQEYAGDVALKDAIVHRSIQITARAKDPGIARCKALDIFKALRKIDDSNKLNFTDHRWGQVYLRQPPFKIKQDEKSRVIYGFNVGITTTIE